jgi:tripartite-type tricarboxylate transporter receptor subunit TctC
VHPSLPVKNLKELLSLARARRGQIIYGSAGNGSGAHLATELLNKMAGLTMVHVPYKGGGPALVDLLAGNIQVLFSTYLTSKPHIDSGRIRALSISTAKRLSGVDIPTIAEAAVPGFDAGVWYALLAPAGTPRDLIAKLNAEIIRASNQPEMKTLYTRAGIEPVNSTAEELTNFMKSEIAKWARVVREAKVEVN